MADWRDDPKLVALAKEAHSSSESNAQLQPHRDSQSQLVMHKQGQGREVNENEDEIAPGVPRTKDVVDPFMLFKMAADPTSNFPPPGSPTECSKKDSHTQLLEAAKISVASSEEVAAAEAEAVEAGVVPARIFCMVYATQAKHATAITAVRNTWASRCDGFIAMSDKTDVAIPALNVPHEGKEEYNNIWQKIRAIWLYVHDRHADDFDYFIVGGDDMYVIVDNLRLYLNSKEILDATAKGQYPLFLGRRFAQNGNTDMMFNSGGAGYVLNRPALDLLAENIHSNPKCQPHLKGFWEDVQVARCLKQVGNILPYDTRDVLGRERFHPFTPGNHLTYRISKQNPDWYAKYSMDLKEGPDCCSDRSVSFHYVKGALMPRLHALLYQCPHAAA